MHHLSNLLNVVALGLLVVLDQLPQGRVLAILAYPELTPLGVRLDLEVLDPELLRWDVVGIRNGKRLCSAPIAVSAPRLHGEHMRPLRQGYRLMD